LGKSFVALDIAAHLTRAEKWPDGVHSNGEPVRVIVLSAEDDPLCRATGSIAFVVAARAVWLFAKNPDDPGQRLLPGKMNLAPDQTGLSYTLKEKRAGVVAVVWGEAVRLSADAVLQPEAVEEKSERLEAKDWLRERLSDGPVSQREIKGNAKAVGIAWRTVRRAKASLGITSEKRRIQGGLALAIAGPGRCQQLSKVSSSQTWTPSAEVDTFEAAGSANMQGTTARSGQANPREHIPDREGPGCTGRSRDGRVAPRHAHGARISASKWSPATWVTLSDFALWETCLARVVASYVFTSHEEASEAGV
jgi:hypothetical protein